MEKQFDLWNGLKKKLHATRHEPFLHEREIWICSLGANIGYEQDGKNENFARPVLVIKKFNNDIFLAVPLSSKVKEGKYYYIFAYEVGNMLLFYLKYDYLIASD